MSNATHLDSSELECPECMQIAEAAEETLKTEEAVKDRLCQELNLLVQQSAHAQLERLEQLTQRMELLNKGFMPPMDSDLEKPAAERQPAVASAASSGAGEAPPPPADAAATQASETPGTSTTALSSVFNSCQS